MSNRCRSYLKIGQGRVGRPGSCSSGTSHGERRGHRMSITPPDHVFSPRFTTRLHPSSVTDHQDSIGQASGLSYSWTPISTFHHDSRRQPTPRFCTPSDRQHSPSPPLGCKQPRCVRLRDFPTPTVGIFPKLFPDTSSPFPNAFSSHERSREPPRGRRATTSRAPKNTPP